MIAPEKFLECLQSHGVQFFAGVPDSLLKELLTVLQVKLTAEQHVIAANEGGAVALAVGYHLATNTVPVVYMQNSGLGNAINPLTSLAHRRVYSIPMVLLIGWRGEPQVYDEPQHRVAGEATIELLDSLSIPHMIVGAASDSQAVASWAVSTATSQNAPVALVFRKNTFSPSQASIQHTSSALLAREEAIRAVLHCLNGNEFIVSTTGMASRELFEIRAAAAQSAATDFLNVGAMGHVSQIGLGIALARPDRKIICLDGDGSLIMHMGALAVIGARNPANFKHVILNNGVHDSVGGQPTVANSVNLVDVARACGYGFTASCNNAEEIATSMQAMLHEENASLVEILVRPGCRKDLGRPPDEFIAQKEEFMQALAKGVCI